MDNHAGNLTINSNYFAGLIDSDFGVYIHRFYPRGKLQLRPTISFSNTNFDLIEICSDYLKSKNINHYISFRKATVGKDKKEIKISRYMKCVDFVGLFKNNCVVRRPQLEILEKFCLDRLDLVLNKGWKMNNTPYTDYQINLFDEIQKQISNYNYDNGYRNHTTSWLAGMIDGDGSICFVIDKNNRIIPILDITTGSDTCLNNIKNIFNNYNLKYDIRTNTNKKGLCVYNIYIKSFDHLLKILIKLKDKLQAKSKQCNLMIDYLYLKRECRITNYDHLDIVGECRKLNS